LTPPPCWTRPGVIGCAKDRSLCYGARIFGALRFSWGLRVAPVRRPTRFAVVQVRIAPGALVVLLAPPTLWESWIEAMPDPKPDDVDFHEETDSPTYADDRNFYKGERSGRGTGRRSTSWKGALDIRIRHQTPPTDQIDHPPADAGAGRVAATGAPLNDTGPGVPTAPSPSPSARRSRLPPYGARQRRLIPAPSAGLPRRVTHYFASS
jgi:hypothetical protein